MIKAILVVLFLTSLSYGTEGTSERESNSIPPGSPPQSSQWHWSIEKLVGNTNDIVVAKLTDKKKSGYRPTIKPDFPMQGGFAAHTRPDKYGKRKSHLDNIWDSFEFTFQIEKVLKGKLKPKDKLQFTAMQLDEGESILTPLLCDFRLKFELGKSYLIFINSYNPNGYQEVIDINDPKIAEIEKLLKPCRKY